MEIHKYLLGFLMFSFIVVSTLFVFNDINDSYDMNLNIDDDFNGTYNKINETYNLGQNIKEDTLGANIEGGEESWESMTKGGYKGTKRSITGSFTLAGTIMEDISRALGIPSFIITFALTAITLTAVFAVIYMVFRFKG